MAKFTIVSKEVDLCVHSTGWKPTFEIHTNFVTRLNGGEPSIHPDHSIKGGNAFMTLSFGKYRDNSRYAGSGNTIYASIYNINKRLDKYPDSFNPFGHYPPDSYQAGSTVFNLEFKLWSRVLKEYGIESVDSLEEKYRSLWKLLTEKKLSLRTPNDKDF